MSLKIDLPGVSAVRAPALRPTPSAAGSNGGEPVAAPVASTRVSLSLDAGPGSVAAAAPPPGDDNRIARLRSAIADGRYTPDPAAIAARLLRAEWELAAA